MLYVPNKYIAWVWATTIIVATFMGTVALYSKDISGGSYNDAWDNPFYNFFFFILIGISESLIPVGLFVASAKTINKISKRAQEFWLYVCGTICTLIPFFLTWGGLNKEHRSNLITYAICYLLALFFSFWCHKSKLLFIDNSSDDD